MTAVDLIFGRPPTSGAVGTLLFDEGPSIVPPVEATVAASLPAMVVAIRVGTFVDATVVGVLPDNTFAAEAEYLSNTNRPLVGQARNWWQDGVLDVVGAETFAQQAARILGVSDALWTAADRLTALDVRAVATDASRLSNDTQVLFSGADRLANVTLRGAFQDGLRDRRPSLRGSFQNGVTLGARSMTSRYQDAYRDRRNWTLSKFQNAITGPRVFYRGAIRPGVQVTVGWESLFQNAVYPGTGARVRPGPPQPDPCYIPPAGDEVALLFKDRHWNSDLIFICDRHPAPPESAVVVPVRRVYIVLNDVSLKRVDGNIDLPTYDMSLSLDFQSWTWGFSANLPMQALADLEPSSEGVPVEVEASINGVAYRFQIERRTRSRSFGKAAIAITGRGKASLLDAPYAPTLNFTNSGSRTAEQLANDVLTLNSVPLGWDVNWNTEDWTVPAGVFSHQGTHISALNTIATAAGAYLQPHRSAQEFYVLPLYPDAPWAWSGVTPDYELPAAVTTQEDIEWIDKPVYNRVYVSGVGSGVLGRVTREGTAGDKIAPQIVDPLITSAVAARLRGTPVLADTGARQDVTLRLPVLEETGIITPGKYVRYVDGSTSRFGIVRGVSVDVAMPTVYQRILVETRNA